MPGVGFVGVRAVGFGVSGLVLSVWGAGLGSRFWGVVHRVEEWVEGYLPDTRVDQPPQASNTLDPTPES